MPFLPDGYKVPETPGKYFKTKNGDNRIRILGSAIVGYEGWTYEHKGKSVPVRHRIKPDGFAEPFDIAQVDMGKKIKHFWAFPVWNVDEKLVQVYQITQKSIMDKIKTLTQDEDWGDPTQYGLVISRSGEKLDTKYEVTPKPKTPLPDEALIAWDKVRPTFELEKLFDNGDPFGEDAAKSEVKTTEDEINVEDIPF